MAAGQSADDGDDFCIQYKLIDRMLDGASFYC